MVAPITVKTQADLPHLNDVVHDAWLMVEHIKYQHEEGIVHLPILLTAHDQGSVVAKSIVGRKVRYPVLMGDLTIRHVVDLHCHDTEHVGCYDINAVKYDESAHVIAVVTGIPLTLTVTVTELDMTLTQSDEIVGDYTVAQFLLGLEVSGAPKITKQLSQES